MVWRFRYFFSPCPDLDPALKGLATGRSVDRKVWWPSVSPTRWLHVVWYWVWSFGTIFYHTSTVQRRYIVKAPSYSPEFFFGTICDERIVPNRTAWCACDSVCTWPHTQANNQTTDCHDWLLPSETRKWHYHRLFAPSLWRCCYKPVSLFVFVSWLLQFHQSSFGLRLDWKWKNTCQIFLHQPLW